MCNQIPVTAEWACYLTVHIESHCGVGSRRYAYITLTHAAAEPVLACKSFRHIGWNFRCFLSYKRERDIILKCKFSGALACQNHALAHNFARFIVNDRYHADLFVFIHNNVDFGHIDWNGAFFKTSFCISFCYIKQRCKFRGIFHFVGPFIGKTLYVNLCADNVAGFNFAAVIKFDFKTQCI